MLGDPFHWPYGGAAQSGNMNAQMFEDYCRKIIAMQQTRTPIVAIAPPLSEKKEETINDKILLLLED